MKKFTRIIGVVCMMGLLTFVSTSCKKNQENDETTLNVVVSGLEEEGERAYIDPNLQFWWHENDHIRVYNLADEDNADESTTAVYSKIGNATTQIARFRGPYLGPRKAEGYRYFYPYNMVKGYSDEIYENLCNANRQTFVISPYQQYHSYEQSYHHYSMVDPVAMPMAARVDKLSDNATLRHLFGVATFSLSADHGTTVVVDSVVLTDKAFNLTGEFSLKLHKAYLNDYQGEEYSLSYAWNEFYSNYHAVTPEYLQNVLYPLYEYWGFEVDYNTIGNQISLNCMFEQDGTINGVTLQEYPNATYFNFMLCPLTLHEGFDLTVYVHDGEPIVLTTDPVVEDPVTYGMRGHFKYGSSFTPDYTWAVQPGTRKIYTAIMPINLEY